MSDAFDRKLIEGNFPCQQVGAETKRERGASSSLPPLYFLHVWWARRPLTPSRAAVLGSILPAGVSPDVFLKELGIRKYQISIGDTFVDVPQSFIEENGTEFDCSDKLERIISQESELRAELREIIKALLEKMPSLQDEKAFQMLLERSREIDLSNIDASTQFTAYEVSANPAWFNEILSLTSAYGIRIPNLYGYDRAYSNKPATAFSGITLLDPTAGGGSIPFEAMRLGCKVIANDLNPVASGIEIASLKYPAEFGFDLATEIKEYGDNLLKSVSDKMSDYFWLGTETEQVTSYLYCREVACPHCGERAPLLNAFALSKKTDGWMVLPRIEGKTGHKTVRFIPTRLKNGKGPDGENPEHGTVHLGTGQCIHCGQAIESEEIKRQARGESQYGTWADRLYCVVGVREETVTGKTEKPRKKKVTFFREPTQRDLDALKRAEAALNENWERWEAMDLIPTESIPEGHKTAEPLRVGIRRWCDMFTPRQLLGLLTAMETLREMTPDIMTRHGRERGAAIVHYLQYMIDKCVDYNSRQTRWHYSRGVAIGTFGRHDFSLKWSFCELVFTGPSTGLQWAKDQVIDSYLGICNLLGNNAKPAKILNGSAAKMAIDDKSVDVICIDPPYYNNVQYAELSDFFYVWQKRTFKELYPNVFARRLTNKEDEAVANPARDGSAAEAEKAYESRMSEIFAECRRVMRDDGIMTMMFTHKTQEAWETLTRALIENGWIISASFPVDSEASASIHQMNMAAAASSIFLACRKRDMENREPAAWVGFGGTGVLQRIQNAVRQSLVEYAPLHLNSVDEMVASYGSALKVLSENWPVVDGDEPVSPIRAMMEASAVVAQHQMTKLTGGRLSVEDLTPEAAIALTLFGINGMGYFAFDDALSLSRSLNISLVNTPAGYRAGDRMIGINDERTGRTRRGEEEEGYYAPMVKKGSKLRLVLPEERNPKRLAVPQSEWDIMQGVIMKYREGDVPVARDYLQRNAEGREDKIIGVLRVWGDGCGAEELQKEARRILFGLKPAVHDGSFIHDGTVVRGGTGTR